jgi:hypothetical protein
MTKQERLEYMRANWKPIEIPFITDTVIPTSKSSIDEELSLMDTVKEELLQKRHLSNTINSDETSC